MKTLQVAIGVCSVLLITAVRLCCQVAPGGNADAIHPAGPPDPQKIDAVWQVDPISDQVTIKIPFTTTPQGGRGPKLPFALLYNSASTVTLQAAGSYVMAGGYSTTNFDWSSQPISGSSTAPSGPWTTTGPYIYNSISDYPNQYSDPNDPSLITAYGCTIFGPFIYVDENGSAHDMNLIGTTATNGEENLYGACAEAQSYVYPSQGYQSFWPSSSTSDSSSIATYNTVQSNGAWGEVIGPDGTSAMGSFESTTGRLTSPTATLTDPNGNPATLAVNSGVYTATDALGRTVYSTNIPIGITGQIPAGTYSLTTNGESGSAETSTITFSQKQIGTFNMPHPTASEIAVTNASVNSPGPGNSYNKFTAVTAINLPDSTSYQFTYDPTYGTISMITFPTGGYVRFCWGIRNEDWAADGPITAISSIVVIAAFTSTGGTPGGCDPPTAGTSENQWTYAMESAVNSSSVPIGQVTAPDGTYTQYVGTCFDFTAVSVFGGKESCEESSRAMYDSSGNLKMSVAQIGPVLPTQVVTGVYDGPSPLQKQTVNYYDSYDNITEKDESDFVSCTESPQGSPCPIPSLTTGPWLRKTYATFSGDLTAACYNSTLASKYIVNKPCQVVVTDVNGIPYSLKTYSYDGNGNLLNESDCLSISGTGSSATCGGSSWQTQYSYTPPSGAVNGQVYSKVEGYGASNPPIVPATTNYTWTGPSGSGDSSYAKGFLTMIAYPNGATDKYTYFGPTGEVKTHVDWNTNTTSYDYTDPLNRIKTITLPTTGMTTYTYNDSACNFSVQEQHLIAGTTKTSVTKFYDCLGRLVTSNTLVPTAQCSTGAILVGTTYDSMSRVSSVSNPYCTTSDPTSGTTQFFYDAVSRKIKTEFADFPVNSNSFSTVTYSGRDAEFTDPFNATVTPQHIQRVNGLGQLIMLCEVSATGFAGDSPTSCGSSISATGFLTTYSYDPLNNLLSANQHGISRSFTYDSLSRLTYAMNPEAGAVSYGYLTTGSKPCSPNPSAPCSKTDARGVTTSYQYDALNRLLSKSYSGDPSSSLFSCYQYDLSTVTNGIGRLANEWTQSAACPSTAPTTGFWTMRSILAYDAMGRLTSEKQYTPSNRASGTPYALTYTYDLDGNLLTSTNGTTATPTVGTLTFTNTYDVAEHLQTLTSNWNDPTHPPGLFSLPTSPALPCTGSLTAPYSALGGLMNATFGTALSLNRSYDKRFRTTCEIDTGVSSSTGTSGSATVTITGQEQSH